jgi:hypothetical protein
MLDPAIIDATCTIQKTEFVCNVDVETLNNGVRKVVLIAPDGTEVGFYSDSKRDPSEYEMKIVAVRATGYETQVTREGLCKLSERQISCVAFFNNGRMITASVVK